MKKMMFLVFCVSAFLWIPTMAAQRQPSQAEKIADVQRAAKQNIQVLLAKIKALNAEKARQSGYFKNSSVYSMFRIQTQLMRVNCGGGGDSGSTCAADCTDRNPNGSCNFYGSDYCGPEAACAPDCSDRNPDGSCNFYKADFCGPDASCSPDCTDRNPDGTCNFYSADICS